METSQFQPIFANFTALISLFKGVYSSDTSPESLKVHEFFIFNTDSSDGIGEHWVSVYKPNKKKLEIFNSLGSDIRAKELYKQISTKLGVSEITYNLTQVQSSASTTCGQFCVYFLIQRVYNLDLTLDELLNEIFVQDLHENEKKVAQFISEHVK